MVALSSHTAAAVAAVEFVAAGPVVVSAVANTGIVAVVVPAAVVAVAVVVVGPVMAPAYEAEVAY